MPTVCEPGWNSEDNVTWHDPATYLHRSYSLGHSDAGRGSGEGVCHSPLQTTGSDTGNTRQCGRNTPIRHLDSPQASAPAHARRLITVRQPLRVSRLPEGRVRTTGTQGGRLFGVAPPTDSLIDGTFEEFHHVEFVSNRVFRPGFFHLHQRSQLFSKFGF